MPDIRIACAAFACLAGLLHVAPAAADTATGNTEAIVVVTDEITLTELTPSFTLTGAPGAVVTTASPVTMRVTTNNFAGYTVTVQPTTPNLLPSIAGSTDVIPASLLEVSGPAQAGTFAPLNPGTPVVVDTKASASAPTGDIIANNYRITIPFVRPDTYTGTLNYIATTL
ncbi:hypothetical protein [Herbidospora daliensis]|uniref:hypothetical protein n=1 Tax=Herbidospora daliensis TaxID=295585 RepID=UPI000AEEAEF6|nr:hypothetical protein [Herbidospora daliensis]